MSTHGLTIDLPPEIFERLRAEAKRQGKTEPMLAQEILTSQLLAAAPIEVPLYVLMLPQIRALVATMNPDDFIVPGNATPDATIAVLRSWTEAEREDEDDEGGSPGKTYYVRLMPIGLRIGNTFPTWRSRFQHSWMTDAAEPHATVARTLLLSPAAPAPMDGQPRDKRHVSLESANLCPWAMHVSR